MIVEDENLNQIILPDILEAPVRLCCFKRHFGVVCPDNLVMCCYCFKRFLVDDLSVDKDGKKQDVCVTCWETEKEQLKKKGVLR